MNEVTKELYDEFVESYPAETRRGKGKVYCGGQLIAYCYNNHYFIKNA